MTGRIQSILAVPALLAALLPGVSHAAGLPACEPNQATTGPCIIELDSLGTQPLVQTLPFDVPVFLVGTASAELESMVVHIFRGDKPIRVDEKCGDPLIANTCTYTCYRQGEASSSGGERVSWAWTDLLTVAKKEECGVVPSAAEWRRPDPLTPSATPAPLADPDASSGEGKYRLRLPPLSPNEHFVFLIEERKKPGPELRARIEELASAELVTVLENNATPSPDAETLNEWLSEIREDGCEVLREIARAEGLKVAAPQGSLFDCSGPPIAATALALRRDLTAISDFYSTRTEIESTLEGCAEDSADLATELAGVRDLMSRVEEEEDIAALHEALEPILEASSAEALASGQWDADFPAPGGNANPCTGADALRLNEGYQHLAASLTAALKVLEENGERKELLTRVQRASGLAETMRGHASALVNLDKINRSSEARMRLAKQKILTEVSKGWLTADTIGTFMTRQKGYIAADFGFAFAPELETAVPYLGTNIYLRPVNKNAPLRGLFNRPMQRFSFSIGLALTKIDDDQVGPLFDDFSLLTGAGMRVTESARLSGGVVWAREKSNSPLNNDDSLTWSPYVAVSLDYDVNSLIKWFDHVFGGSG